MLEVFSAVGRFVLDDQASGALDKVEEKAEKTSKTLGQKLGGGFQTVGKYAAGFGIAAGAAGAGLFAIATKGAAATDRIDKMSQRLGMSRQAFQEWDFILSQNGISIDSMQMGMKTLSTRMAEAGEGAGKGAELFGKLGVSVTDASGNFRNQEDVFRDSVVALQGMEDGIEKAALAQELFGRNGQELLPMLNQSKGSIDELTATAHGLGLVLGDEAVDAGVQFSDTMDQMKRMGEVLFTQVGTALIPVFQKFSEWVIANMPQIQAFIGNAFTFIGTAIEKLEPVFTNFLIPLLETTFEWIMIALTSLSEFWDKWGETIITIITTTFDIVSNVLNTAFQIMRGLFDVFVGLFTGDWQRFGDGLSRIWETLWEGMKDVFFGIWNAIIVGIEKGVNSAISGINQFIRGVNRAIEAMNAVPGVRLPTVREMNEVSLPRLAEGGDVLKSGWAMVGEEGPEFIKLNAGAQVRPLDKGTGGVVFQQGAFEGAFIMDDYGVDRLMNRVVERLRNEVGFDF